MESQIKRIKKAQIPHCLPFIYKYIYFSIVMFLKGYLFIFILLTTFFFAKLKQDRDKIA